MREKNGRNAMNASKVFLTLALCLGFTSFALAANPTDTIPSSAPPSAKAEPASDQPPPPPPVSTAPTLYEMKEVLLDYPILTDPKTSSDCGLTRESMLSTLHRNLQDPGLDVMLLNETHPRAGVRAHLTAEITTVRAGKTCWSWIHVPFVDRAPIMLPPLKVPRMFTLIFWEQRRLVTSPDERHQTSVSDMLSSISRQFLRDVKLAVGAMAGLLAGIGAVLLLDLLRVR